MVLCALDKTFIDIQPASSSILCILGCYIKDIYLYVCVGLWVCISVQYVVLRAAIAKHLSRTYRTTKFHNFQENHFAYMQMGMMQGFQRTGYRYVKVSSITRKMCARTKGYYVSDSDSQIKFRIHTLKLCGYKLIKR